MRSGLSLPMPQTPLYRAAIEHIVECAPDTRSFFLRLGADQVLRFRPGQFLSFQLPGRGKTLTRAYTIASSPEDDGPLEICLNRVPDGLGSQYLFDRRVGDQLSFSGPWGGFVFDQAPPAECVFIAEGTGIAAIRPMLRRAIEGGPQQPLALVYATAHEQDLLYREQLEGWDRAHAAFSFRPLLVQPAAHWGGLRGDLLAHVEAWYVERDTDRSRHFYICGIGQRVLQLRDLLRAAGYERRAVKYEKW